jgi:membrane-associated phospholipid phosphatase
MLGYNEPGWSGKMPLETRKKIASLTSNILNPFVVGLITILFLSFESTSSTVGALKWSLILVAIGMLPVFLVMLYLARKGKLDSIFTSVRQQRTGVYLLATLCAVVGGVIITCLEAPLVLRATFVAGFAAVIVFMVINLWWKISLHIAFIAASATVLIILYGYLGAISLVFLPLMGWARVESGQHTPAQVAAGAFLAVVITVVVFCIFELI